MDSQETGMNQGTDGAHFSASAAPALPDIPPDEPVISREIDIFTHPTSIPHYMAHLRGAKWSTIIWLVLGLGILESVASYIGSRESGLTAANVPGLSQLPSSLQSGFDAIARLSGNQGNLLTAVVGVFFASFIYWLLAKLFGGQGTYLQTAWLFTLVSVPIQAVAPLLGLIPVLGLVAGIVLAIAQLVFTIFAMAAAHRISVGKATVVVLIPFALALVIIVGILSFVAGALAGSLGQ